MDFSESDVKNEADVRNVCASQVFQDGNQIQQLIVVSIGEPAADRDSVLGVEDVGRRRVVDDYRVLQIAADLGQILDVVTLVVVAALPKEPVVHHFVNIQLIQKGVAVLSHNVST